jgi:hypothetical protein
MHNSEWRFLLFRKRVRGHLVTITHCKCNKAGETAGFSGSSPEIAVFMRPLYRRCTSRSDGFGRVLRVLGTGSQLPEGARDALRPKVIRSGREPRKGIRCLNANLPATTTFQVTGDQEAGADYLAGGESSSIRANPGPTDPSPADRRRTRTAAGRAASPFVRP